MDIDPEKLAHTLKSVEAMPEKDSRSYLAPAETIILELRAKKYSFRVIQKLLADNLGVKPSLSTLHHFEKQAKRRKVRRKGVAGSLSTPTSLQEKCVSQQHLTANPVMMAADDDQKMKNAIRALKAKAEAPIGSKDSAVYVFDKNKPLTIRSQTKKD